MLDSALNGARGAELGVTAAAFAASGAAGPRGVLDGRWGILKVMSGGPAGSVTAGLGERWEFADTKLKPYASCRFTHGPVAALRAARLDPQSIASVEIVTFRASVEVSDRPQPRDRMEAILSHQLAAALALLDRPLLPRELEAPDATVRALAARVHVRHDPALDAAYPTRWPHRIVVSMRTGERVVLTSDYPPAADGVLIRGKFRALATPVLGGANVDAIIGVIHDLEHQPDVQPLLRLLRHEWAEAA